MNRAVRPSSNDPRVLAEQIAHTRDEMRETLEALERRLGARNLVQGVIYPPQARRAVERARETADKVRHRAEQFRDTAEKARHTVQENPRRTTLIGLTIAGLAITWRILKARRRRIEQAAWPATPFFYAIPYSPPPPGEYEMRRYGPPR